VKILCSISTKGRYHTTLPLAIQSVISQTRLPDKLVIFDDNDKPEDLRNNPIYYQLFLLLENKGIEWSVIYGQKKGQHHNHEMANKMGYDWVWRLDDDTFAEPTVLENLIFYIDDDIGAIGGAIITPSMKFDLHEKFSGKISDIYSHNNLQWIDQSKLLEVEHLHCSFLYRAGINDYCLELSKKAHREETIFTYGLYQKGYKLLVVPNSITWHLKMPSGGIRSDNNQRCYNHDEEIFSYFLEGKKPTIVVLDNGMGDHIVFKHILNEIENPIIFSCYPEIVPGRSIGEARELFVDLEPWNLYKKMDEWRWNDSLENAFRKLYIK
jgi:GT2 family glycosyltransferase